MAQMLKRLFTVDEFQRMGEAGILTEDDRVELIGGEIVTMTPIGPSHASCVNRLTMALSAEVRSAAIVSVQNPVLLSEHSQPQPDVVLLKPRPDFYRQSHPASQDVLLVIEVADTTVEYDRVVKVPEYARAGVPEVWIVNLPEHVIEVYRQPAGGHYGEHVAVGAGSRLTLPGLAGRHVAVDEVLA